MDEAILGFSNRWYPEALRSAQRLELRTDLCIRLISAPAFIATKLEAFNSRGKADVMTSHDLEDLINVVDGRPELTDEVGATQEDLRRYLAEEFENILRDRNFRNCLPGLLADPDRVSLVMKRLKAMTN